MSRVNFRGFENFRARGHASRPLPSPRARLALLQLVLVSTAALVSPQHTRAQVSYVARFSMEKGSFLEGEPIFCDFTIQNTGGRPFAFSYRTPSRTLNPELPQEPRFEATDEVGRTLPDPAPKPCGGAKGTVVYGSVSLPPGQSHTERWLLNQWARFSRPGRYQVHAERRLPLLEVNAATQQFSQKPAAYALAINELSFEVQPSSEAQLEPVFAPYLKALDDPKAQNAAEAALVVTALPHPFLLEKLVAMARAPAKERRWDRLQALEGLARLGTRAAWEAILKTARGEESSLARPAGSPRTSEDEAMRAYAILLLGEKADAAFLPPLLEMASTDPEELRDDVLRALGFFHDARANQVLFEKLHSPSSRDRVNAILGLKNLESKEAVPALLAMLKDPDTQVRHVAHFALQSLTGRKIKVSPTASRKEFERIAGEWHTWWRENGGTFVPARQPACQDW